MAERPLDLGTPAFAGLRHDGPGGVVAAELLHNSHIKVYPDAVIVKVADAPIYRESGWEAAGWGDDAASGREPEESAATDAAANLARARRRARAAITDICRCNQMRWFVTLTLDSAKIDRYDTKRAIRAALVWLNNNVQRRCLAYVVIPELHKDGAVHFHGMFNDALEMVDSGTIKLPGEKKPRRPRSAAQRAEWLDNGGRVVYNIPAWRWGFTTATEIDTDKYRSAIGYVAKYIGKGAEKVGNRWYYHGGELRRPVVICADLDWNKAAAAAPEHVYTMDTIAARGITLEYDLEVAQDAINSLV